MESIEKRRLATTCVEKNLTGLTTNFEGINVHENYLSGLEKEEFYSGLDALAQVFYTLYTGMISEPQIYAMKNDGDVKGLIKNMNFLLLLAQKGILNNDSLEIDGNIFASALKEAKVTKTEIYFHILESLGFITIGLDKKIEASEKITVEFPDNKYMLTALKAMADAVGMFSGINPNRGSNYFNLLDYRVLERHPAAVPKDTMEYILSKLKSENRDVAQIFYEFVKPFVKCDIKGDIGWYWTPTFTLKSTKKVIMSLKLTPESHDVKLNLSNIGKYTELLEGFPAKMIDEITDGGWDCGNCNSKCESAFVFDLDGKSYRKCRCGSFVFMEPDKNDSKLLLRLLKKEVEFA